MLDTKPSIEEFYSLYIDIFFNNRIIKNNLLHYQKYFEIENASQKDLFKKILNQYIEEAALTLSLVADLDIDKTTPLLEIGAGIGLVYTYLKKLGYNIYGIEPAKAGFDEYFKAGLEICRVVGADSSNYLPLTAQECTQLKRTFEVIFSNNVLEHIIEINQAFKSLSSALAPTGIMIHNTVNYLIPYDPHFKIALVPIFPKLTSIFKPELKRSELWNNINFINTIKVRELSKSNNLSVSFNNKSLKKTFLRLETDCEFAERQQVFRQIGKLLKHTGLVNYLDKIPVDLNTPMLFRNKKLR